MSTQEITQQTDGIESGFEQMGIPAFFMSLYFWMVWVNPLIFGVDVTLGCTLLLVVEFVSIHSSFMIAGIARAKTSIWLILVYAVFIVVPAVATKTLWPILFFAWHVYETMKSFRNASEEQSKLRLARWIGSTILFMAAIMLAVMVPWPDLGWRAGIVDDHAAWVQEGTGKRNYHITPAWGTLYFFFQGMMSLHWPSISKELVAIAKSQPSNN